MSWSGLKARINSAVKREFGDPGTYTPLVGTPLTLNMLIYEGVIRDGFDSKLVVSHDEIAFLKSDVADMKRGDTFDDGTTTFTFVSPIADDQEIPVWLVKK